MSYLRRSKPMVSVHHVQLWFQFLLFTVFLLICFYILTINIRKSIIEGRDCYTDRYLGKKLELFKLDDILLSDHKPRKDKSIFFHETSCSKTGKLELNARQACAIESAALLNPSFDIFVLFASPTSQSNQSLSEIDFNLQLALKSYTNIYLRNVNLWSYTSGTPIYGWLINGEIFDSNYLNSHISDLLRFVTLWRWGGTYLDLDFIIKKSLEDLQPNYACAETERFVAAGVINLDNNGYGHKIADMFLKDFEDNFNGQIWSYNGPGVITRVLQEICKTKLTKLMTRDRCFGFKVFSKEAFYSIGWWNWTYFFERAYLKKSLELTKESIAIHVWNKYSSNRFVKVQSKVAYGIYAEKYCPKVYSSCGSYF